MKVAIYNKWLDALGGGEKVTTVMAEALKRSGYDVSILTTFNVDPKVLEGKMGVDLRGVEVVALKQKSFKKIAEKTKEYDLFINTSYLDVQPSEAKNSIYYVHFPSQVRKTILGFFKYETVLPLLRKLLVIPHVQKSLDEVDDVNSRGGLWLKRRNTIILSNPPKSFKIVLHIYSGIVSFRSLNSITVESNNAKMKLMDKKIDHHKSVLCYEYQVMPKSTDEMSFDIKVYGNERKFGCALVSMVVDSPRYLLWNIFKRYLPRYEMALYGSGTYRPEGGLGTYDLFLVNSKFTKKWTKRYWLEKAEILYPPVDVEQFIPSKNKKNYIINVGRFFVGGHSKRQDVLVSTFKEMIDKKLLDKSWELHLVGGVAGGWEHASYVKSIKDLAKGYPVYFHFSASYRELKDLYSKSKIYWHATGYQQYVLRNPIAFEHFGISVVEAMAAGCVPVVFNGGGLTETVKEGIGFLWKNPDQLEKKTMRLVNDSLLLGRMSKNSIRESKKYSREKFSRRFLGLVKRLVNEKKD